MPPWQPALSQPRRPSAWVVLTSPQCLLVRERRPTDAYAASVAVGALSERRVLLAVLYADAPERLLDVVHREDCLPSLLAPCILRHRAGGRRCVLVLRHGHTRLRQARPASEVDEQRTEEHEASDARDRCEDHRKDRKVVRGRTRRRWRRGRRCRGCAARGGLRDAHHCEGHPGGQVGGEERLRGGVAREVGGREGGGDSACGRGGGCNRDGDHHGPGADAHTDLAWRHVESCRHGEGDRILEAVVS